jgi:hypothetical protein
MIAAPLEVKCCLAEHHNGPNPLPVADFYRDPSTRDGLRRVCARCDRAREREWRRANRARVLAAQRARFAAEQAETRRSAGHHREPWTVAHLAVALRPGITATAAALRLGRTRSAVRAIRRRFGLRAVS